MMNNSYIAGLNVSNHDSSACLLKNGELVSFAEQERFTRNKLAIGEPPIDALQFCLQKEHIQLADVEAIAIGMDWSYRKEQYKEPKEEQEKYIKFNDTNWYLPKSTFGETIPPVYIIRHHLAHAASAYRLSGFEKSAVLIVDNRGEDASSSFGIAEKGKITFFKQINIHNSLGIFYNRACRYTGLYGKYREVGKFMGLASYGIPNIKMPLSPSVDGQLFKLLPYIEEQSIFNAIQLRTDQLATYFKECCFPFESGNIEEIMSYANFAASVQKALEDTLLCFVKELKGKTSCDNLVMAGGVALNCSANGKIERSKLFRNIYVPPFPSDSGTAVGAALELNYQLHGKTHTCQQLRFANLGASYLDDEIIKVLRQHTNKLSWQTYMDNELFTITANELAAGKIIAWMQGEFEAGPRALGNRSIIADPRNRKNLIKLNKIKGREMWRPIAPSILAEHYSEYFSGNSNNKYFMNIATLVKKEKQNKVPAIVHVDETARPQIVPKENKRYYKLIKTFYEKTGIPLVCNTSFNTKGIPLINTPENAVDCFLDTDIDLLVIGNIIVNKIER